MRSAGGSLPLPLLLVERPAYQRGPDGWPDPRPARWLEHQCARCGYALAAGVEVYPDAIDRPHCCPACREPNPLPLGAVSRA